MHLTCCSTVWNVIYKDGKRTDHWHRILEMRINVLLEDLCVLHQKVTKNLYLVVIALKLTATAVHSLEQQPEVR